MALSPLQPPDERITEQVTEELPLKTYEFDFDTGEIGGFISGEDAIRQFIRKALVTPRFRCLIYDDTYGSELEDLIGQDISAALLGTELERIITEALIYDDRIIGVYDFEFEREADVLYASFTVETIYGEMSFSQEVLS